MNGKIYKIVSEYTDKIYIGSTTGTLKKRLSSHISSYKRWKNLKNPCKTTSFDLIELGNVNIELIEELEIKDRYELLIRENYWIEKHQLIVVNKAVPLVHTEINNIKCNVCGLEYRNTVKCKSLHKYTPNHQKALKIQLYDEIKAKLDAVGIY